MAISSRAHVQTRLQNLLSSIQVETAETSPLYTRQLGKEKQLSVIALFDNGIDPDPAFSGSILGRLYIDEEANLALATWPMAKEKAPAWRKEVLLSQVESFACEFLGDNSAPKDKSKETVRPINAQYAWRSHRSKADLSIPSVVRLVVQEKGKKDPLRFAFILPSTEPRISYRGKKA